MKKGSKEHPLCHLGGLTLKSAVLMLLLARAAGGLWCFSFVDIQELQFLGEREALLWAAIPGSHFFQKIPCTCSQIVALWWWITLGSRCQRHQCSVEIVHFFHFMSSLDYIKEEGKNLKAENMLKQVMVVTELTTARKFQVRVLTPSSLGTQSKSSTSKPLG